MNNVTLKPCPMCAETQIKLIEWPADPTICEVFCLNCKINTGAKFTKEEAIKHWNTRAYEGTLLAREEDNERLERALRKILPMAKGYAAKHKVGSNQKYIEMAKKVLGHD